MLNNSFIYKKIKKEEWIGLYYSEKKSKEKKKKEKGKKAAGEKKNKKEKKAAIVQRLKPKHCSYSANWTNQIGTAATVQNLKKDKR